MKDKMKIRTMKDDLANTENEELSEVKQDQNKTNIAPVKTAGSNIMPGATPGKLEDKEIDELKNLIKRISKNTDKKIPAEKQTKKEDVATGIITDTMSEKIVSKQQEQTNLKIDEKDDGKKELENLVNKVSKTIEKKDDQIVQAENLEGKLDDKKETNVEYPRNLPSSNIKLSWLSNKQLFTMDSIVIIEMIIATAINN